MFYDIDMKLTNLVQQERKMKKNEKHELTDIYIYIYNYIYEYHLILQMG